MITSFTKLLSKNVHNTPFKSLTTIMKQNFANPMIFHKLDIDTLSDKWHIDLSYTSSSLTQTDGSKVKPYAFGRVFAFKFIQKSMRFTKGRPEYRIQLPTNQAIKLSYWSPQYGKFEMIRSNLYKEEVFLVEKVIKDKPDPVALQFPNPSKAQSYPLTLYRFNFFVTLSLRQNNKLETQKSKEFFLTESGFLLFQLTLKSSFQGISFSESKEEYEIWNLESKIARKDMIINKPSQK